MHNLNADIKIVHNQNEVIQSKDTHKRQQINLSKVSPKKELNLNEAAQ